MNRKAIRNLTTAIILAIGLLITPVAWAQGGRLMGPTPVAVGDESALDWLKALWHSFLDLWTAPVADDSAAFEKDGWIPPPPVSNAGICLPGEHGVVCDPDG